MMEKRQIQSDFKISDRTVEGYAVCFDKESKNIGWIEVIHKGAITEDTIRNSDILAKFNHNSEKVLARSKYGKGSLILDIDDYGVKYMFEAPNTDLGNELLEYLNRGDITSSSFAFSIDKNDSGAEKWYKKDGIIYREIYKIDRLYDVSPVFQPAYEDTTCSARYEEVKATSNEIDKQMDLMKEEIENL